jgi:hypothetical protein
MGIASRHRLRQQVGGQLQRVAPRAQRELLLDAAHEEHDRELQPLGLVHGEDGHGVVVRIRLRHRGVVTGLAQEVEVGHERGDAVVFGHVAVALHDLEEARDVLDPRLRLRAGLLREAGQEARRLEEAVQDLARAPRGDVFGRGVEIGHQARGRFRRGARDAGQLLVRGKAAQHLQQGPVLPRRVPVQADEVPLRHGVELAARQVEDGHGVVRRRQRAQERHEQPDFFARVETAVPREPVRQPLDVERAQERVGVGIAPHQDREIARAMAARDPLLDEPRHHVRLRGDAVEMEVAERPGPCAAPSAGACPGRR